MAPRTRIDWLVFLIVCLIGIAALGYLLPWMAQHPFILPPDRLHDLDPGKKPLSEIDTTNLTPVVVGITVVTVCCLLYGGWMTFSMSRLIVVQSRRK